jgi:hypothetical protein
MKDVDGSDLIFIVFIICGTAIYIAKMVWG